MTFLCKVKFSICFISEYKAVWKENLAIYQKSLWAFLKLFFPLLYFSFYLTSIYDHSIFEVRMIFNVCFITSKKPVPTSIMKIFASCFIFALGCLCKCMQNKSRLAAILFLCCANLPRFDARIRPHFHTSSLSSTHKLAC